MLNLAWSMSRRVAIRRAAQAALASAALFYALCAAVYCLPTSPAKVRFQIFLQESFARFFFQNWSLFAPDPIDQDDILLVSCSADPALATTAQVPDAEWEDIISPMWDLAREYRLSPWERLSRTIAYPVRAYQGNSPDLALWAWACVNQDTGACDTFEMRAATLRRKATQRMGEIATSYCRAAYPTMPLAKVALRVRMVRPPPWSRRFDGAPLVKDTDVGVFSPSSDVIPASFFVIRAGRS